MVVMVGSDSSKFSIFLWWPQFCLRAVRSGVWKNSLQIYSIYLFELCLVCIYVRVQVEMAELKKEKLQNEREVHLHEQKTISDGGSIKKLPKFLGQIQANSPYSGRFCLRRRKSVENMEKTAGEFDRQN